MAFEKLATYICTECNWQQDLRLDSQGAPRRCVNKSCVSRQGNPTEEEVEEVVFQVLQGRRPSRPELIGAPHKESVP